MNYNRLKDEWSRNVEGGASEVSTDTKTRLKEKGLLVKMGIFIKTTFSQNLNCRSRKGREVLVQMGISYKDARSEILI